MDNGKTINLREVLYCILVKRRILLIWMIIFAFVANGFACLKSYREISQSMQSRNDTDYSQYENELSETEIEEVKNAVDNYIAYEQTYMKYKEYMENSIKMQLDATNVPTQTIIYRINGNDDSVNIADTYMEVLPNDKICQETMDKLGLDIQPSYIRELISVKSSHMYAITLEGQQFANVLENDTADDAPVLVVIEIISDSESNTKTIGEIVENNIESVTKELQGQFGAFNIQKIADSFCKEANKELLQSQQTTLSEMNSVNSLMKNLESSLTETQQPYFLALLENNIQELEKNDSQDNIDQVGMATIDYINLKYIVVGAGAGLVLFALYILCKVIFDRHLNSICYIEQDLKSTLIGVLYKNRSSKKIKDKINKKLDLIFKRGNKGYTQEQQIEMICADLVFLIKKKGINSLYITGSQITEEVSQLFSIIDKHLKNYDVNFTIEKNFLCNVESLEKFAEADGGVFIEQMNKSLNEDILKEVDYCKKYSIDNLGFIIVE